MTTDALFATAAVRSRLVHWLLPDRVNVHSSNLTNLGYARDAGYPNLGYAVTSTAANPPAATVTQYGLNVFVWVDNTPPPPRARSMNTTRPGFGCG